MDEATLVRRILDKLRNEYPQGVWYKIHTGPFQERGIPDIIGVLRGRFIAFEVKRPNSKRGLTNYQKIQLDRINSADGRACVITSAKEALSFLGKNFKDMRPRSKELKKLKEPEVTNEPQEPEVKEPETEPEEPVKEPEPETSPEPEVKADDEKPKDEKPKKDKKKKSGKKSKKKKKK